MGLFGERIGERIKPVTPCGAAGAGHGERILSSVKVFKSILSPGKARKIRLSGTFTTIKSSNYHYKKFHYHHKKFRLSP